MSGLYDKHLMGEYGCDDGAGLVQCLSVSDHVADPVVAMVSAA